MAITKTDSGKLKNPDKVVTDIGVDNEPTAGSDNLVTSGGIKQALDAKQNTLTFDDTPTAGSQNPVTSDGIKQAIDAATPSDYDAVKAQVQQNTTDIGTNTQAITGINAKIPAQASAQNQLADKAFVNSSIQTNTATFRGTYNLVSDLGLTVSATEEQVAAAIATHLASLVPPVVPENNDYVFVQIPRETSDPTVVVRYDRYKCTVEEAGGVVTRTWAFEFSLNNSSFTAEQWAAINSGITSELVAKLGALPTAVDLAAALLAKYEKPLTGIPKSDLSSGVQTSLEKADTALQTAPVTSVNSKIGAVVLDASDVGALGNTGDQTLEGTLEILYGGNFTPTRIEAGQVVLDNGSIGRAIIVIPYKPATVDTFALLSDIYAAVRQIAPDFTAKAYELNELCSYNGVIYRCKLGYTTSSLSPKPNTDTTHWEAKKVSELLAAFTVKSVKRNGTALTPDANGAVDVIVPTDLNGVCPDTENWLGVPGTTAGGKSIKVLAKTVSGVIEGGMTVTASSTNNNNTTKYRYGGVTVTRNGIAIDYLFDNSQNGIARLSDLSNLARSDPYIRNPVTGLYHKLVLEVNDLGNMSVAVEQEGIER